MSAYDNWKTSDPSCEPEESPCRRCRSRARCEDGCEAQEAYAARMKAEEEGEDEPEDDEDEEEEEEGAAPVPRPCDTCEDEHQCDGRQETCDKYQYYMTH